MAERRDKNATELFFRIQRRTMSLVLMVLSRPVNSATRTKGDLIVDGPKIVDYNASVILTGKLTIML